MNAMKWYDPIVTTLEPQRMPWDDSDPAYRFVYPRWDEPYFYLKVFICRLRGHQWTPKTSGQVCTRCRQWEPDRKGTNDAHHRT